LCAIEIGMQRDHMNCLQDVGIKEEGASSAPARKHTIRGVFYLTTTLERAHTSISSHGSSRKWVEPYPCCTWEFYGLDL
jgi:hypothetical protein